MWCLVRRDTHRLLSFVGGGGVGRLPWVGVSWKGPCCWWWVVGALLGPERTGRGGSRRWVGVSCVGALVGPACCHTAAVLVVLFGGLVVFVVGGGVVLVSFVV